LKRRINLPKGLNGAIKKVRIKLEKNIYYKFRLLDEFEDK
jgi:hypothetical protein